jgi:hypothetical protein
MKRQRVKHIRKDTSGAVGYIRGDHQEAGRVVIYELAVKLSVLLQQPRKHKRKDCARDGHHHQHKVYRSLSGVAFLLHLHDGSSYIEHGAIPSHLAR